MTQPRKDLSNAPKIIVVEHLNKFYGTFQALKDVSLSVQQGEVVVVIGPSGSGKSTFIRCLNRLEEHQSGRIVIDNTELTNDVRNIDAIRRDVGMVFQSFNLFPHLSVLENITIGQIRVKKIVKTEAEKMAMELRSTLLTKAGMYVVRKINW